MKKYTSLFDPAFPVDQLTKERHGQWLLIAGGIILGSIGIFVEEANQHPLTTVWFRCVFGGIVLLIWSLYSRQLSELRLSGRQLRVAIISGILMILNWSLFFAAITRTSIAVATVVFHIQPFWVMIFGVYYLGEAISPRQWAATLIALCGLSLTTGLIDENVSVYPIDNDYIVGLVMCLGGSLSYAAVTVIAKTERQVSSFALAWWQCVVGAVVLVWTPFLFGWPNQPSTWFWLIGLGAIHTGIAYVVLFNGMARVSLGKVALLQFVYPLTAVIVDWLVYGRILDFIQLIGVAMMSLALWSINRPGNRPTHQSN